MSETAIPTRHAADELVGGKYRLVRQLGQGGMGSVWEARNPLERRFAIKFLLPELAESPQIRQRFEREARAAAAIESEHVVDVFDFGVTEASEPFIVMEYLKGEDLGHVLAREGRLSVPRTTELVRQAATGLHEAHLAGVIHRDLKPQNLFVTPREDGTELCRVLDFGVAKLATRSSGISTKTGNLVGTLDYMSPEQLRGDDEVDARADVYSLGCVLYQCLAGRRPFDAERAHVLMYRILEARVVPLSELRPELPKALTRIVHRALETDPERRFASAQELASALAPFSMRAVSVPAPADATTLVDQPAPASARPRPRRRVVLALGAVAVAGLATFVVSRSREPQAAPGAASSLVASRPTAEPAILAPPPQADPVSTSPVVLASPSSARGAAVSSAPASPSVPMKGPRVRARVASSASAKPPAAISAAPGLKFDLDVSPYD